MALPSLRSESFGIDSSQSATHHSAPSNWRRSWTNEEACRTPGTCDNYRYEAVSMPYRNGGTDPRGWTRTKLDAFNRPIEVRYFDGGAKPFPWESNATSTGADIVAYDADQTTATDPSGRQRSSNVDGFGRLVQVREDPIGLAYGTYYAYDVLDNLNKVTQDSRIRDFEYTSLSRLKSTTQPETGTINYTYDNNGNLLTRGDARGVMTIGGYDALNRIQSKSSNVAGTPAVQYGYDACPWGKGRLCSVTATGVGGSSFEYDNMGRPVKKTQTIGALPPFVMQQAYLPSGAVAWMTYPTGTAALPRKVSNEYWPNGQLKAVWQGDVATGSLYASVNSYYAAGVEKSVVLGNQLLEDTLLNSRLQVAGRSIIHSTPTIKVLWSASYDYQDGSPNDGNLKVQTISGLQAGQALSFTQTYAYDSLSRLRTVKDSGLACGPDPQTSQKFVYDRYGNKAVLASSCGESSGTVVPFVDTEAPAGVEARFPANRLSDSNPDGSGNQRDWAGKTFVYDGENRLYQANVSGTGFYRYSYDGEGKRVKSQRFETPNVAKESTYYIYDASGQMIVETDGVTPLGANPERKYLTADHLGSTRLMTKSSGTADTIVESRYDYYPFGEEIARGTLGYGASVVRPKFTGQVRDGETGLDFFESRYFSSAQGRFTSPDALIMKKEWLADPQRWNHFAYVRNNPLRYIDPNGEDLTIIYSYGPDASEEQKKWFEANKAKIFAQIQKKFNEAGVQNVAFKSADTLSKAELNKLVNSPVGNDNRTTGITGVARLEITGQESSVFKGYAPLGAYGATYHGLSGVFMDRTGNASSSCDSVCGFANIAAHEIGHGLGFDDPGHNVMNAVGFAPTVPNEWFKDNVMKQGGDPYGKPLPFRREKNQRVIDEVNRAKPFPQ